MDAPQHQEAPALVLPPPGKLPAAWQDLADALVAPLEAAYPVADLFLEERWRLSMRVEATGIGPPTLARVQGVQLRFVEGRRANAAWTTDLSEAGLRRAWASLETGLPAIRRLPPRPAASPWAQALEADFEAARRWAEGLSEVLRRALERLAPHSSYRGPETIWGAPWS